VTAIAAFHRTGVPVAELAREHFPLKDFGEILAEVRRKLIDGRGIVMLQGFPVEGLTREDQAISYLGLGSYLGRMPQNKQGHVLGHVKDLGGDYNDPNTRGYMTRAEMRFHNDPCDYVGLLCLQTAKSGGTSLASLSRITVLIERSHGSPVVNDSTTHMELGWPEPVRVMSMHTLSSAARAVGVARSTIWRAVKAGGLSAHKLTNGTYSIYPGELLRAFPRAPSLTRATIALAERKAISFPVWDVS
jgi:hypothetical protein